jgi:NAD(P)-dependent dehydrogenase (short-subunit alcohol dehydrogenase family)
MKKLLKDKVVVITGATRGFGYAIAEAMLKANAIVVISGRSQDALTEAIASLDGFGLVKGQICDVKEEHQVYGLARFAVQSFGHIDIWINNAGYSSGAGSMLETPPDQAIDMFLTNDMGTLYGSQAALFFMKRRREGTLVNVYGNGSFLRPASPTGLYGATKAWITSFTRSLAKEMSGSGIKLIGFSPGMMLTDMLTNPVVIGERQEMMKRYAFVLRFLGMIRKCRSETCGNHRKQQKVYRISHVAPSKIMLRLLRARWQDLTKRESPEYTVHPTDAYNPESD